MNTHSTFSCFIIGEGSLPVRCAEILLDQGHTIYGIISSDEAVSRWARASAIPHLDPGDQDLDALLSRHPFDYLFSIVNEHVLPARLLDLPQRYAINYHDAPLPAYAGSNATSWAILRGERMHGVTWHAMTELVDAGDIFKQHLFEIDASETAFTLNAKCYDAAMSSFTELIDDLSRGRLSVKKQNLAERTFFPRSKRPSPACILSWNRSAREVSAFVRALDFGSSPNRMGLPRLIIEGDCTIVSEIEVLDSTPALPPGTVTRVDPAFVGVSTLDGEVALCKLLTADGQPLPVADFVAKFGLREGYRFGEIDQRVAARVTADYASLCQHEAFWTRQLETLENLTLPYARPKTPHLQTPQHSCIPMPVPSEILTPLEKRFASAVAGDVLLAAFAAYLARIAGVGSFDIGYRDAELDSEPVALKAIFAAFVPLHVGIEYEQSFENVFHAIQERVRSTKQRKTYARDIVACYPALRSRANSQGAPVPSICVERAETPYSGQELHGSELTLVIREDKAECLWVYDTEVLDRDSVVRMQRGFAAFLQAIASDPRQRISDLPVLTRAERDLVLAGWHATRTPYPRQSCIHHLFEAQVGSRPDTVAVIYEGASLTYRELDRRANQLAHYLQELGVGPEVLVGLCVERSLEMVVGLLGILKAGGAYVPLDPTYPAERLAFMLEDCRAPVLVTQQHLLTQLPATAAKVVCLDAGAALLARQSEAAPVSGATSDHLAYVIYTSGSTGKPKGVQIPHRAVVNFLWSMHLQPGLTAEDTWLAVTTLSFDIAALELFLPLIVGARVIVASRDLAANGTVLAETLASAGVTVMQATPITWRVLLAAGWQGRPGLKILCGGEALPLDLARQLLPRGASLWNLYGPTETTIWSTVCKIEPGDEVVTIGRPIANTQIYLLDPRLQPVPVGVPGELYIGGDGLARGYLNRSELTAERFLPHPFSSEPGARLYRTGDLARYRAGGAIEHLGRLDYQVKLRGFRIELGEIDAVLAEHPAVRQAVVVAREDAPGDKRLVAYVVLREKQTATVADLQHHMAKQLPNYMVPVAFVLLEAIPLTPNGKVDRRALPAPGYTRPQLDETFAAPGTQTEEAVAGIWSRVLGIEQIGIHDDFFALGGDSLRAMQVISHLRRTLQIHLPLARFFKARTVAELARIIEQVKAGEAKPQQQEEKVPGSWSPVVEIQTGGSGRPFFYLHGDFLNGASYCFPLVRHLGPDQTFYALEPYKFDALGIPPTLEAMAAVHLESVRSRQPKGPYLLGGFCNGALVAYEIARQLHAEGEKVDLLILIDPNSVGHRRLTKRTVNRFGKLMRFGRDKQLYWFLWLRHLQRYLQHVCRYLRSPHYRKLITRRDSERADRNGMTILTLGNEYELWLHHSAWHLGSDEQKGPGRRGKGVGFTLPQLEKLFPEALFPTVEALWHDWEGLYFWVMSEYEPGFYPGKSTFFFTKDRQERGVDEEWRKVAEALDQEIEIHRLAGGHDTCKTIHLLDLTEQLRLCLNEVQMAAPV